MKELSPGARALLAAFAETHQAPADLGDEPWNPDRARASAPTRWIAAAGVSVAMAAAALLVISVAAAGVRAMRQAASEPAVQVPFETTPRRAGDGVQRSRPPGVTTDTAVPSQPESSSVSPGPDVPLRRVPSAGKASVPSEPARGGRGRPPPASGRDTATTPPAKTTLAAEIALIDAARSALEAGDLETARRHLERHEREHAEGTLTPERRLLRRSVADVEPRGER